MAMAAQIVATAGPTSRRYSFYSPELHLIAESEYTDGPSPALAYEYIWVGGEPVAQIEVATSTTHWTFTDHIGTPILQTEATSAVGWRGEHEPYGQLHQLRNGGSRHQPLRSPGQEAEQIDDGINGYTERSYNIFRWFRAGSGRYTQADPSGLSGGINLFGYASQSPATQIDPLGLFSWRDLRDLPRWGEAFGIFRDWLNDTGEINRKYGPADPRTEQLNTAPAVEQARRRFLAGGCKSISFNEDFGAPGYGEANLNATRQQVGGFIGTITPIKNGYAKIRISNELSMRSFFRYTGFPNAFPQYHPRGGSLIPAPNTQPFNHMGDISQDFWWVEKLTCCQ